MLDKVFSLHGNRWTRLLKRTAAVSPVWDELDSAVGVRKRMQCKLRKECLCLDSLLFQLHNNCLMTDFLPNMEAHRAGSSRPDQLAPPPCPSSYSLQAGGPWTESLPPAMVVQTGFLKGRLPQQPVQLIHLLCFLIPQEVLNFKNTVKSGDQRRPSH